jgi:predicted nuclease with TOPRIM domain
MTSGQQDMHNDTAQHVQRIYQRLDKFEERIDQLEGQMTVASKWLERIEQRLGRLEEVRADLLQALTKLQTELELKTGITDKEKDIIMQLLNNDKKDRENLAQIIEGEKGRRQERFLQIWAVLGPVIASVLTSFFTRFFQ